MQQSVHASHSRSVGIVAGARQPLGVQPTKQVSAAERARASSAGRSSDSSSASHSDAISVANTLPAP